MCGCNVVALLAGQQTCDSQAAGSSPGWASYLHLCASVTKQYSLVPAKKGDHFGWESNRGFGGK